jgi:hypothetical protein
LRIRERHDHRRSLHEARGLQELARNPKESWIVVRDAHEPLVPPDVFDRAGRLAAMRGGLRGEELRTSKRNSPFVLSGLIVCARCGARRRGRTTHNGRRSKDRSSTIKTPSYACGSYVRKGSSARLSASFLKEEIEADVIDIAVAHDREFAETGGAAVLAALAAQRAAPDGVEPIERIEKRLAIVEKRIEELLDCLTPALASAIESKIAALRQDADLIRGQIDERRATAIDAESATAMVRRFATSAAGIEKALATTSTVELREVLRGLVREIRVDAAEERATVTLFALSRIDPMRGDAATDAGSANEETTVGSPRSSYCLMAGAGLAGLERTILAAARWASMRERGRIGSGPRRRAALRYVFEVALT